MARTMPLRRPVLIETRTMPDLAGVTTVDNACVGEVETLDTVIFSTLDGRLGADARPRTPGKSPAGGRKIVSRFLPTETRDVRKPAETGCARSGTLRETTSATKVIQAPTCAVSKEKDLRMPTAPARRGRCLGLFRPPVSRKREAEGALRDACSLPPYTACRSPFRGVRRLARR